MHVVVVAFYATKSAFFTVVIISLDSVIEEVAHGAKVGREFDATVIIATRLGHGLPMVAHIAHDFFYIPSVHFMCLGIIVAVAAHICFPATRRHQAASAHIVFALVGLVGLVGLGGLHVFGGIH